MAIAARTWPRGAFETILAINNAHAIRSDWDQLIYPHDFPETRIPKADAGQRMITEADFVPAQNAYGGFVYAGGTMALTAAYWALHDLRPKVIATFGCDMHYPRQAPTHFYGTGTPDPLRRDVTLRSLEAKSARAMILAAMDGCAMVNLSDGPSRLVYPRVNRQHAQHATPAPFDAELAEAALRREEALGYDVPSGRYWEVEESFDPAEIDALDALWLLAARRGLRAVG
jgi:hypothetical protein